MTERLADSYRREAAGSNPRRATMSAEAVLSTLENDGRWSDIAYESPEPRPPKFEPFRALSHLQRLHVLATAFSSAAPGPVCVHLAAGVPVHGPDVLDPDTCDRGDER